MENIITNQLSASDWQAIDTQIASIEAAISGKLISLTPAQRKTYGRIGDHYMEAVHEISSAIQNQPVLNPDNEIFNNVEYLSDYDAHKQLSRRITLLRSILERMEDTQMAHEKDLYRDTLIYYAHIQVMARSNKPGAQSLYESLKRFFKKQSKGSGE